MKLFALSLAITSLVSTARAQYFSPGWDPTKAAISPTPTSPPPKYVPEPGRKPFSVDRVLVDVLASKPLVQAFSYFGINITERIEIAEKKTQLEIWDTRIPLITDDNYNDLIVNEPMTPEEERQRVWFLVITVRTGNQAGISELVDRAFDAAYNETVIAGDLPNVRWGRIDYMSVTALTTRWSIWRGPYIVVLTDRGKTLRFYQASQLRIKVELIREFLKDESWKETAPWSSMYSPGGKREWVMEYLAIALTATYKTLTAIPKWFLILITGGLASAIMGFLHRPQPKKVANKLTPGHKPKRVESASVVPVPVPAPIRTKGISPSPSPSPEGKRTSTRQRKTVKK